MDLSWEDAAPAARKMAIHASAIAFGRDKGIYVPRRTHMLVGYTKGAPVFPLVNMAVTAACIVTETDYL